MQFDKGYTALMFVDKHYISFKQVSSVYMIFFLLG